jgi:hypothetical protein
MTIYVKSVTSNQGREDCSVVQFSDRQDLARYADIKADIWVMSCMTIDDILDELYDTHIMPSTGSVTHSRISHEDAIALIQDGAINDTFLEVKRKEI